MKIPLIKNLIFPPIIKNNEENNNTMTQDKITDSIYSKLEYQTNKEEVKEITKEELIELIREAIKDWYRYVLWLSHTGEDNFSPNIKDGWTPEEYKLVYQIMNTIESKFSKYNKLVIPIT